VAWYVRVIKKTDSTILVQDFGDGTNANDYTAENYPYGLNPVDISDEATCTKVTLDGVEDTQTQVDVVASAVVVDLQQDTKVGLMATEIADAITELQDVETDVAASIATADSVVTAVADAPAQTAAYVQADVQAIATLANDLKAKYNAAVTLINELKTMLNNADLLNKLTALRQARFPDGSAEPPP
jgi:hypothetical protein